MPSTHAPALQRQPRRPPRRPPAVALIHYLTVEDEPPALKDLLPDLPPCRVARIVPMDTQPLGRVLHVVGKLDEGQRARGGRRARRLGQAEGVDNTLTRDSPRQQVQQRVVGDEQLGGRRLPRRREVGG